MPKKGDLINFGLIVILSIIVGIVVSFAYKLVQKDKFADNPYPWETKNAIVLSDKEIKIDAVKTITAMNFEKIVLVNEVLYFIGKIECSPSANVHQVMLFNDAVYFPTDVSLYRKSDLDTECEYSIAIPLNYFDVMDIAKVDSIMMHVDDNGDNRYDNVKIAGINLMLPMDGMKKDKVYTRMTGSNNSNYDVFFCGADMSKYNCDLYLCYVGDEFSAKIYKLIVNNCEEFSQYSAVRRDYGVEYYSGADYFQKITIPISSLLRHSSLPIKKLVVQSGSDKIVFEGLNIRQ